MTADVIGTPPVSLHFSELQPTLRLPEDFFQKPQKVVLIWYEYQITSAKKIYIPQEQSPTNDWVRVLYKYSRSLVPPRDNSKAENLHLFQEFPCWIKL